jgi:isopentenyldiphosphate isomerase
VETEYPPIVQVDDSGQVLGPIRYEEAHKKSPHQSGIRHATSSIFIFNNENQDRLLVTKRSHNISRPNMLNVCVGGHAIWLSNKFRAQTPKETAITELAGEIFYDMPVPDPFGRMSYVTGVRKDLRLNDPEYCHLFRYVHCGPFKANPEEVSDVFFEDTAKVREDVRSNPQKYVRSARFYLDNFFAAFDSS